MVNWTAACFEYTLKSNFETHDTYAHTWTHPDKMKLKYMICFAEQKLYFKPVQKGMY